jgi:hypothetical protein
MKRRLIYLLVALATWLAGVTLHRALQSGRPEVRGARRQPSAASAPGEANRGARCLPRTLYVREKVVDIEGGVVNPVCAELQSGLLNAAAENDVGAAQAALLAGAHPDAPGYVEPRVYHEAKRPLVRAAWAGSAEAVRLLLDYGADIEQEECCCMSCDTPLSAAIEGERVETVRLLLLRGADVNHVDQFAPRLTALRRAESKGNREVIELVR